MDDISNHAVCQSCRGICCVRFQIAVQVKEDGRADWDKQCDALRLPDSERAFFKEHFKEVRQPGDAVRTGRGASTGADLHQLWFTCTALKNGRCSKYEDRPQVCRIHLCEPAERHGVNPELLIDEDAFNERHDVRLLQHFPGIMDLERGGPDLNFVKPVDDYGSYVTATERERMELYRISDQLVDRALARAGYPGGIVKLAEELKAKREAREAHFRDAVKMLDPLAVAAEDPNAKVFGCPSPTT